MKIEVETLIGAVVTCCDESVLKINIGNDYIFEKKYIDELFYRNDITNSNGELESSYQPSVKKDTGGKYLFCISKSVKHYIEPDLPHKRIYTINDYTFNEDLINFNAKESDYWLSFFSMLRVFKKGNIGIYKSFFRHHYCLGPSRKITVNIENDEETWNQLDDRVFSLTNAEAKECNKFLADHFNYGYVLLKPIINKFIAGLNQLDHIDGFNHFITTLEMALLNNGEQGGIKARLSKRTAVLLGHNTSEIKELYFKMTRFYKCRSESLHDGNDNNVTDSEFYELEEITRCAIKKLLELSEQEIAVNDSIALTEFKSKLIQDLIEKVAIEKKNGTFSNI